MNIISWNIQAGKGVDGVTDLDRITGVVDQMGKGDIICFQEVLQDVVQDHNGPGAMGDQASELAGHFPEYHALFGASVDRLTANGRIRFGNLMLSRLPVIYTALHKLPQPADSSTKNMPRQAIEMVVTDNNNAYRIVTTHLEYFSAIQRSAHVGYLCQLHQETLERANAPSIQGGDSFYASGPETALNIFCGDFNLNVDSTDYFKLAGANVGGQRDTNHAQPLNDAWRVAYPDAEHAPTCGIFDHEQWSEGAHCRDFFFVSTELVDDVSAVKVDTETAASDHQPIMLTLT